VKNFILALVSVAFTATSLFAGAPALPRKAPELAFNVPGQGQKLLSQYRGKVVALEFIYTTCPHCQAASKVMSRLQNELGSRGLQVLDVAINPNADLAVDNFAKEFQTTFPVGWVSQDQGLAFMGFNMAERFVVPQLVLIDRQGIIRYQTPPLGDENSMKEETIRQRVEELLSADNSTTRHNTGSSKMARAHRSS
jgi:cytochrome oxidase Cu insertion factor (SCO1/SenC/PrrC family)